MVTAGKRVRARGLVVALGLVVLAGACASNRTPERSFTTRVEAEAAGMFDAAGVPAVLVPASAEQLRERRDLDTGAIWARFEFAEGDRPAATPRCEAVAEPRLAGSATRGIGWWPELLRNDPATARQHFDLFACRDDDGGAPAVFALHKAMPTAFYWRSR